jgi:cyclomaltodextrinase / maltogenic alpha-amylase / neopullulanase
MTPSVPKSHPDHIFGDIDLPENSAAWFGKFHRGIRHYLRKLPHYPRPGDAVRLLVTTSVDQPVESVHIWMTTDDWKTQTEDRFTQQKLTWHTAIWSYLQEWELTLPAQPAGTMLRYKIGAKLQGSQAILFADSQTLNIHSATHFSIWYGGGGCPDWAKDAIIYQIFVDRFSPGKGKPWKSQADLRHHFGGTLQGVTEKLPFNHSMGFNTVWLTPIFESPSHHGYDISDYFRINPRMGTMDDFLELLESAHQLDLRVTLDFVANHCSNQHPFFQDAINDPDSHYHDYFVWKTWPEYESFYNVRSMPKFDLAYGSPARDYLLQCARYWLEVGVDGYRLDYAHGPEQDFWVDFHWACSEVKPEYWTFAEITQPADVQTTYAGGVGGALDFLLCQAIRSTFAQQTWSLEKFAAFLQAHHAYYPKNFRLPSFLDNHDMNRFLVAAKEDVRLLKIGLLVLYTLPEPPIIYYGTEVPFSQNLSIHAKEAQGFDEARLPMDWDAAEKSTLPGYLAKLAEIRRKYPDIHQSGWIVNQLDEEAGFIVLGKKESQNVFLIINRSIKEVVCDITGPVAGRYVNLLDGDADLSSEGKLLITLKAMTAKLIKTL